MTHYRCIYVFKSIKFKKMCRNIIKITTNSQDKFRLNNQERKYCSLQNLFINFYVSIIIKLYI